MKFLRFLWDGAYFHDLTVLLYFYFHSTKRLLSNQAPVCWQIKIHSQRLPEAAPSASDEKEAWSPRAAMEMSSSSSPGFPPLHVFFLLRWSFAEKIWGPDRKEPEKGSPWGQSRRRGASVPRSRGWAVSLSEHPECCRRAEKSVTRLPSPQGPFQGGRGQGKPLCWFSRPVGRSRCRSGYRQVSRAVGRAVGARAPRAGRAPAAPGAGTRLIPRKGGDPATVEAVPRIPGHIPAGAWDRRRALCPPKRVQLLLETWHLFLTNSPSFSPLPPIPGPPGIKVD